MIHIHPHEPVREGPVHVAGKSQRVIDRLRPMIEAVLNALGDDAGDATSGIGIELFPDDIAAEWQR
jgi:hypothetical protein